jgi:hypothetical protein
MSHSSDYHDYSYYIRAQKSPETVKAVDIRMGKFRKLSQYLNSL